MKTNKYKALDLYKLSTRKNGMKTYKVSINEEKNIEIRGYVIKTEKEKKEIMNLFLKKNTKNKDLTRKIISDNYIVGLFSNEQIIFILSGKDKSILEDFNKKISEKKYQTYFKDSFDGNNTFNPNNQNTFYNEKDHESILKKRSIDAFRKDDFKRKDYNINNPQESSSFLNNILKDSDLINIIKNEEKITEGINSIKKNIKNLNEKELGFILKNLKDINIPLLNNIKKELIKEYSLKSEFLRSRERRKEIFAEY